MILLKPPAIFLTNFFPPFHLIYLTPLHWSSSLSVRCFAICLCSRYSHYIYPGIPLVPTTTYLKPVYYVKPVYIYISSSSSLLCSSLFYPGIPLTAEDHPRFSKPPLVGFRKYPCITHQRFYCTNVVLAAVPQLLVRDKQVVSEAVIAPYVIHFTSTWE